MFRSTTAYGTFSHGNSLTSRQAKTIRKLLLQSAAVGICAFLPAIASADQYIQSFCEEVSSTNSACISGTAGGNAVAGGFVSGGIGNPNDNFWDPVYGEKLFNSNKGRVVSHSNAPRLVNWAVEGNAPGDYFGFAVVVADINGDGADDVIAGASQRLGTSITGSGYWKALNGPDGSVLATVGGINFGDEYGCTLAVGDKDQVNGTNDIAAGAPAGNYVDVYSYSPSSPSTYRITAPTSLGANPQFGYAVEWADLNGDGRDDLAVGAPNAISGGYSVGAVAIYYSGTGTPYIIWGQRTNSGGVIRENKSFGFSIARVLDSDGVRTGREELAIGDPDYLDTSIGQRGQMTLIDFPTTTHIVLTTKIGGTHLSKFGTALSSTDWNPLQDFNTFQAQRTDLIVGAPNDQNMGKLEVFSGSATGLASRWIDQGQTFGTLGMAVSGADWFGTMIYGAPAVTIGQTMQGGLTPAFDGRTQTYTTESTLISAGQIFQGGSSCNSSTLSTSSIRYEQRQHPTLPNRNQFRIVVSTPDTTYAPTAASGNNPFPEGIVIAHPDTTLCTPGIPGIPYLQQYGCALCMPAVIQFGSGLPLTYNAQRSEWEAATVWITIDPSWATNPQSNKWVFQGAIFTDKNKVQTPQIPIHITASRAVHVAF